jgi:4-amino-4-deoxy-L-arabinose transferase-like glycosyltransferase
VSERALSWLALATVISTLWFRLGYLPLLAPDEGRNAEVAREMKESSAWLVPSYNGAAYLDKPAFFFKVVALSLAVFGNTATAARIPSAVAATALLLLVLAFCRKVHGTRCGLIAVIVVATTPLYVAYARTVIFDMLLALFVSGAVFAGYLAEQRDGTARRNWYLGGAALAGLATLVKGPVGCLIPMLVLLVFNRLEGQSGAWKRLFAPLNIAVFLLVTIPWFVSLCLRHPDFLQYGLVEESFRRFTSAKRFDRSEPFYFYLPVIAAMFVPWSFLLPEAMWVTWKKRWPQDRADRLCLVWAVLVVAFFSISQSKLPAYILSVTVPCGILVARLFDAAFTTPEGWAARLARRATTVLAWVCLVGAPIATWVASSQTNRLARSLHLSVEQASGLVQAALPLTVVVVSFAGLEILVSRRRSVPLCFLCLAVSIQACGHASLATFSLIFEAKSARQLAGKLAALPTATEVVCLECFPSGLPFYLGRTLTLFSHDCGELTSNYIIYSASKLGRWPERVIPRTELRHWLASREGPACLIAVSGRRPELNAIAEACNATVEPLSAGYLAVMLRPREAR